MSTQMSKFLSLVLRHRPEVIGISLDKAGWTPVPALLEALTRAGKPLTRVELETIVATNDKQRFAFSRDGRYIRANQGHSASVDLGLIPCRPPTVLYHGTVDRFMEAIQSEGLRPGQRQHVHLHEEVAAAKKVAARRGQPVVLTIAARAMWADNFRFYVSANNVWLTDNVPPDYFETLTEETP